MRKLFGSNGFLVGRKHLFLIPVLPFLLVACATESSGETAPYHPASGTYFTISVRSGDSVSVIAERYHVEQDDIVAINSLHDQDEIRPGMRLMVPAYGGGRPSAARETSAPAPVPVHTAQNHYVPKPVARPAEKPASKPASKPAEQSNGSFLDAAYETITGTSSAPAAAGSEKFLWPVTGTVLAGYGSTVTGERNDGINIAATAGAPVRASAAGVVTYAGNELKGYGNLVLIRHDNGFVTAYAHNERLAVNRGDHVQAGQVIGYAGTTGDVSTPQVHFEIRKGTKPVDPKSYLVMASN